MLHDAQRTSAPSAFRVSISTAVWIVMCSDPAMRAPRSGWVAAYSSRIAISPGISVSAMAISLRPQSASLRSATLKSVAGIGILDGWAFEAPRNAVAEGSRHGRFRRPYSLAGREAQMRPKRRNAAPEAGFQVFRSNSIIVGKRIVTLLSPHAADIR